MLHEVSLHSTELIFTNTSSDVHLLRMKLFNDLLNVLMSYPSSQKSSHFFNSQ